MFFFSFFLSISPTDPRNFSHSLLRTYFSFLSRRRWGWGWGWGWSWGEEKKSISCLYVFSKFEEEENHKSRSMSIIGTRNFVITDWSLLYPCVAMIPPPSPPLSLRSPLRHPTALPPSPLLFSHFYTLFRLVGNSLATNYKSN